MKKNEQKSKEMSSSPLVHPDLVPIVFLTALAALLIQICMARVGAARGKFKIPAPRTDGPDDFLKIFRTHQNQIEGTAIFLPALWAAALSFSPVLAFRLGLAWIAARVLFIWGYSQKNPERRIYGLVPGVLIQTSLSVLAIYATAKDLFF